jgi:hypothetical protein
MKENNRFVFLVLLGGILCLTAPLGQALTEKEVATINKAITNAPVAELAVKSAEIVTRALDSEKEATAVAVVSAALTRKPASAISVVSSTVRAAPATAPAVAAAAVRLVPDQVEDVAVAAALQAPLLADQSVAAIIAANPRFEDRIIRLGMSIPSSPRLETRTSTASSSVKDVNLPPGKRSDQDKRLERRNSGAGDDGGFPFSQDLYDYGNHGHPPHPVHPPHPPHPPHPVHPEHPRHPVPPPSHGGDNDRDDGRP